MRTAAGDKIFRVIRSHIGRAQSISAHEICRELGWSAGLDREVRRIIADESCLWKGVLVCAHPGRNCGGYFCAETYEEAATYRNWIADLAEKASVKLKLLDAACLAFGFNFRGRGAPRTLLQSAGSVSAASRNELSKSSK